MNAVPFLSLAANSNETGGEDQSTVLVEDERVLMASGRMLSDS